MKNSHQVNEDCIGIICGEGDYPKYVLQNCLDKNIKCCAVFLNDASKNEFQKKLFSNVPNLNTDMGQISLIIQFLRENRVNKVVFAGAVKRPNFNELNLDITGMMWLLKLGASINSGDDALLKAVSSLLEGEGFEVISGTDFLKDIFVKSGIFSEREPTESEWRDIKKGFQEAKKIGRLDIGQSVIVFNEEVLGTEQSDGTNELIKSCENLRKASRGGVLVKASKPQQDLRLDLPTVGVETVELLHECGFSGLAVESNHCIVLDKSKVIEKCNEYSMFFVGIEE